MKKYLLNVLAVLSISTLFSQEKHFTNLKQLTYGGDNAEAYFSPNGKMAAFQSNNAKWGLSLIHI